MSAVEALLKRDFPDELAASPVGGTVKWIGSADLRKPDPSPLLAIYLHRITVDPNGRNRLRPAEPGSGELPQPELPLDLHFLLISWGDTATAETRLHAYGVRQLAAFPELDISDVVAVDPGWQLDDKVQIAPSEVATEDLFRIWDALSAKYSLTSTFVMRTARIALEPPTASERVKTRAFTSVKP